MARRGIGLLPPLGLALISCCAGCAPLESGTPRKTDSTESEAAPVKADSDPFRTVKVTGVLKDRAGTRLTGVLSVLFAIYEQPKDGAPLWQEVQNLDLDIRGHFSALVGSTKSEGIPAYLFAEEEPRWLGTQVLLPAEVEQPRIRLASESDGLVAEQSARQASLMASGYQPESTERQGDSSDTADSQDSSSDPDQTDETDARSAAQRRLRGLAMQ